MGIYEEQKQLITEMSARLREQDNLLQRLTSSALTYAVVVSVGERPLDTTSSGALQKGTQVLITGGGNSWAKGQVGTIVSRHEGDPVDIQVRFGNGDTLWFYPDHMKAIDVQPTPIAVVVIEGKTLELELPKDATVQPGDTVKLSMETMQIVDIANYTPTGEVAIVRRRLGDMSEVDFQDTVRVVHNGRRTKLKKGDRVLLDTSGTVILRKLGGRRQARFRFEADTNVSWSDIGGLSDAKAAMIEAIELPHQYPELFGFYSRRGTKGILLYGPPGCGKTMLGKAAATSLRTLHGAQASGFFYVKGPEILDRYVGVAEATVRQLFEQARQFRHKYGHPAVIFIDEGDAILGRRGTGISSDVERTIVPMFLTEMDGLEDSGAVVIVATNRPDVIDPAVLRDGRIDRKIKVSRPTATTAIDVFDLYLRHVPFANGYNCRQLAEQSASALFSNDFVLYDVVLDSERIVRFTLGDLCNGGMIAGIVDKATSIAITRDLAAGGTPTGLRPDDLNQAISLTLQEVADMDHSDEVDDFVEEKGINGKIVSVGKRLTRVQ